MTPLTLFFLLFFFSFSFFLFYLSEIIVSCVWSIPIEHWNFEISLNVFKLNRTRTEMGGGRPFPNCFKLYQPTARSKGNSNCIKLHQRRARSKGPSNCVKLHFISAAGQSVKLYKGHTVVLEALYWTLRGIMDQYQQSGEN